MQFQPISLRRLMMAALVGAAATLPGIAAFAQDAPPPPAASAVDPLVTGRKILLPPLGVQSNVGSLPMNLVLTPDGKYAVSTDMGFRESLNAIDTQTGKKVSSLVFGPAEGGGYFGPNGLYYGLAVKSNGDGTSTLYASEGSVYSSKGNSGAIAVIQIAASGKMTLTKTIPLQLGDFPAGLALDNRGYLYVANNETFISGYDPREITTPGSLIVLNAATGAEVSRYKFQFKSGYLNTPSGAVPFTPTNFPLAVAALSNGSKVYVSSQRDNAVYVVDTSTAAQPTILKKIETGQHPISLLLDKAQGRLFVANAHSDSVSVVSTASDTVSDTILLQPTDAHGLAGVTPTGLGLTPDESRLYVSLGDFNAIGAIDLASDKLVGYIPAGWYPTGVVVSPNAKLLLVTNAKGSETRYPNSHYQQYSFNGEYDLNLIEGNVQTIPVPNATDLSIETQNALDLSRVASINLNDSANPLADISFKSGQIKHVFYIIKENRTYDQVLGDDANGNGDAALALFGKNVTPNLRALADRFVLLDNFYDCAEASGDGWPWSTQSQASEYVIKNLPYNYSGRGRNYDFEGTNNNYPVSGFQATDPYGQPLVPNSPFHDPTNNGIAPPIPDVSEAPGGHIWEDVLKNVDLTGTGLSSKFRNYGFFSTFGDGVYIPDNYPGGYSLQPAGHDLGGNTDIDFRRFDTSYADSDGPAQVGSVYPTSTYGHYNSPSRFSEWNREFQEALAKDPSGSAVPVFSTIRFMHDHTQGLSAGKHTPTAEVADNDYCIGQFVETISKSKIWDSTAIFILEDDAQDGPDHVDCHRSTAYVISPFIKYATVDHTFYNTDSILHTMELLLNIPPLTQYDAIATPILDFDKTPAANGASYTATLPSASLLSQTASADPKSPFHKLEALCATMDFSQEDKAPAGLLNEVIWQSVKGVGSKMPAPRHTLSLETLHGKTDSKTAAHAKSASAKHAPVADGDDD